MCQPLQKRIPQRAPHQAQASADRLGGAAGLQAGVDLDEVHGDEAAGLVDALGDVVALAEGEAAADGGAGAGGPLGVEGVDVEGEVDGRVGAEVAERELHDGADAVSGCPAGSVSVRCGWGLGRGQERKGELWRGETPLRNGASWGGEGNKKREVERREE